jgi:hypothetical protein
MISTTFLCYSQDEQHGMDQKLSKNSSIETVEPIKLSDLENNGVNTSKINSSLLSQDLEKILDFDFSPYRNYSSIQKVALDNNFIIELYSLETMISKGIHVESSLISSKKNTDHSGVIHDVIPKVSIGFGKYPAQELK